ncbi:GNAT family N-acetyltransferase [Chryseosolibacter indicus]|uniref:GNAT family N-acetyltransferase n=1 Tax=Chryseosolibacter indicus TaxID=2782351 RepID=A0ABS5VUH9_9BACT|nr:GNAT family N-acetyltransferase [Chryseosolibacter indicus]MBT1705078.1 GNAT family N-acetyltransferase [Chryseosolibacter indicus]
MQIRLANEDDVEVLTVLFNSDTNVFGEDDTGYGTKDLLEYVFDTKKKFFVCEYEGKVVGALLADYHQTYSYLDTLIVDKLYQKKGVGSALFQYFEEDLEKLNIPLIEVLTEVDNSVMQEILKKRGFREGNTFKFFSKGS